MPTAESRADVLGLFAKWPRPGRVKSRLAAETTPAWAAAVAHAFLLDLLERFAALPVRRLLAFDPPGEEQAFAELVRGRFELVPQEPGDLGARLAGFLAGRFRDGAERVVVIGADSPTLPVALVERAFAGLGAADVVLGPAADGGYYLLGATRPWPELFAGIPWGGPRVLFETVARVAALGLRLALLPPWYDVDTLADWWLLRGHLAALRQAGADPGVPHTERLEPFADG